MCIRDRLEDEAAVFLLWRGFAFEHEECLLELPDALIVRAIGQIAMGHSALLFSFQARRSRAR